MPNRGVTGVKTTDPVVVGTAEGNGTVWSQRVTGILSGGFLAKGGEIAQPISEFFGLFGVFHGISAPAPISISIAAHPLAEKTSM